MLPCHAFRAPSSIVVANRRRPVTLISFGLAICLPSRDSAGVTATPSTTPTGLTPSEHGRGPIGATAGPIWERLESQIDWYDSRARSSQLWFKILKVAQIVVAAAIPVVAAAGGSAAVAGAMGAAVVVV